MRHALRSGAERAARFVGLILLAQGQTTACVRPPSVEAQTPKARAPTPAPVGPTPVDYDAATWGDSSGKDGKGGVKLLVNSDKKLPVTRTDFDRKRGDKTTDVKPTWLLYPGDRGSLTFDLTWVTQPDDKFYSLTWAGGGVAFNQSWGAVDATGARRLVLWAKTTTPGIKLAVGLHSNAKDRAKVETGKVLLSDFSPTKQLDGTWRRFVIPLSTFPDVEQLDLKTLDQLQFDVKGGYPENAPAEVYLDDMYLTDLDMLTPVSNLGYLVNDDGVLLQWDSDPSENVQQFDVRVDGRSALKLDPKARSAFVLRRMFGATKPNVISVVSVGVNEPSEEQSVSLEVEPAAVDKVSVKLGPPAHDVSPLVLGINFGPATAVRDIGATVRRWGGNRTTKYNWKYDVDSAGSDWFFLNDYSKPQGTPEEKKKYYEFIKDTLAGGAQVNFTIPISDWIAKPGADEKQRICSFPTSKYPDQEKTDGQGCGNGRLRNGQPIWDNDPSYGMVKNTPAFEREFVETVVKEFGPASRGGVQFYTMDNEPGLWRETHRDTLPKGISAEQLAELNIAYASAVKAADPSAKVIGFAAWGVLGLFGSNEDFLPPGPDGYKHEKETKDADKLREQRKHGGDTQLVYLLKRFRAAEATTGHRLIDAIDVHWYPELYGKDTKGEKRRVTEPSPDDALARLQWEALHEWYDPAFKPNERLDSWTGGSNADHLWTPYHPVIPALKKIVDTYYPGTKLAIDEYDVGGTDSYDGALLRAAALGIFMQEGLYMAQNWYQADRTKFSYWGQKLFGNYDGHGSHMGGKFVPSQSSHADLLSYATTEGGHYTIVLINKNRTERMATKIEVPKSGIHYRTYTLSESLGLRLREDRGASQTNQIDVTVPAYSAVLIRTES